MYEENCTAWQSVLQRTDTPCIIRTKLNTYHARVLYCARKGVSLHHHIQAGPGVYALLYIYIYIYIIQVEIRSLELRRPEQDCGHATSSFVIFK